uniref:Uncharacterized protein n=1 Tax=Rhizophora mucronata TaxID=61149 RepID=A0A2P2PTZ0_RHIMU
MGTCLMGLATNIYHSDMKMNKLAR